jgi:hypothetical protein
MRGFALPRNCNLSPARQLLIGTKLESESFTLTVSGPVTLPVAKARGFSAERLDAEQLAGCPPELLGVRLPDTWRRPR